MPQLPFLTPIGLPFTELLSVDSTNNYAFEQIHDGLAQHGATFFAHEQLKGKGQRGKTWAAKKANNLVLSIVIDPRPLLLNQQFQLSACVAVSAWEFFSGYAGDATTIKWPNDIYWQDRKAGGILIENVVSVSNHQSAVDSQQSDSWKWAVAGIGININQTIFPEEIKNPVSLKQITGKQYNPVELAKEFCSILNKNFTELITKGFENIYSLYLDHLYKKNQVLKFKAGPRIFEATVKTVSLSGSLVLQHSIEEEFDFGQVEWLIN